MAAGAAAAAVLVAAVTAAATQRESDEHSEIGRPRIVHGRSTSNKRKSARRPRNERSSCTSSCVHFSMC